MRLLFFAALFGLSGCDGKTVIAPDGDNGAREAFELADAPWAQIWRKQCPENLRDWLSPGVEADYLD
jgi:hypothetical protein